ncbi:hypothetical protein Cgig2_002756 [Carnegiea gigantea]|uniref:Uncharacterized protein n=1 Tax=Carnegiea gigantea TaxID=171969 RepID=A0A9Q1JP24_9CARY|nr:hypothetical protein Cgig2_002756 [Carnegiea gigantea]
MEEKVESWKTGTPTVGMMVKQILQRGDYGEEFKRDFVINDDYFVKILKSLAYKKEKQRPMVSHSKPQTTDAVERKNKDKKKFPEKHGRGKRINKMDHQTWPSASPATAIARVWKMLEIIEEDVRATLPLPMDTLEVRVVSTCEPKNKYSKLLERWRRILNHGRIGTPKVRMMVEQILQRGDHGSMNDDRFFIRLKSLWMLTK